MRDEAAELQAKVAEDLRARGRLLHVTPSRGLLRSRLLREMAE